MQKDDRNIYQTARKAAGLTQEAAAEQLAVSVESLRAYEGGHRVPGNDIVERMVVCYDKQYLAYQHLHETNALAARVVPELEQRTLIEAAIRIVSRFNRLLSRHSVERLVEIAEDDKIDESERDELDSILIDLLELSRSGLELGLLVGKEDDHGQA